MSQKPKFTHSTPLTADALAALFDALLGCETRREAMYAAREILAELDNVDTADKGAESTATRP